MVSVQVDSKPARRPLYLFKRLLEKSHHLGKAIWLNNPIRKSYITQRQNDHIKSFQILKDQRLVIFLAPGNNRTNGGIISILSLAAETEKLFRSTGAGVFVCSFPSDPPLLGYTGVPTPRIVSNIASVLDAYNSPTDVIVHIPELYVARFLPFAQKLLANYQHRFKFNIMLQNVRRIPTKRDVKQLKALGPVTVTTAHEAYSGAETEEALGCPVHYLSVWISPENYDKLPLGEKENIFILSPDKHPKRTEIVKHLGRILPNYRFVTVQNMSYTEYKHLISTAKYCLTFGEGLDGYYIETIFSGGISCAVYNDQFFTSDFLGTPFLYESWDELLARVGEDIRRTEGSDEFNSANDAAYRLLSGKYSYDAYKENISKYYKKYFFLEEEPGIEGESGKPTQKDEP